MSYSISKLNFYINLNSFGNNQTDRNNINFGIYQPSTENTGSIPLADILVGPQVVFTDTRRGVGTDLQDISPTNRPSSFITQENNNSVLSRIVTGSILQATSSIDLNINSNSNPVDLFDNIAENRARNVVQNAITAARLRSTNYGRGGR
jgi:hypothetical protein